MGLARLADRSGVRESDTAVSARATRTVVAGFGAVVAIAGLEHGVAAQSELEQLVRRPGAVALAVTIKNGGKAWPMPAFLARVAGHVGGHARGLRALSRHAPSGGG